jgi:hypothetical protein
MDRITRSDATHENAAPLNLKHEFGAVFVTLKRYVPSRCMDAVVKLTEKSVQRVTEDYTQFMTLHLLILNADAEKLETRKILIHMGQAHCCPRGI